MGISQELVGKYMALEPLVRAMHNEFRELSKKRADGALSPMKVKVVNRLLKDVFKIFENEPQKEFLDLLDDEALPQYSDVALMLGQVCAALTAFRDKHTYIGEWQIDDEEDDEPDQEREG